MPRIDVDHDLCVPPFGHPELDCIPAGETFEGTWPWKAQFFHGNGFAQHYVDEGQGKPIVLLHGEPTWGYLYRNFIGPLSKSHRVIVPDHMGFGKSETPQNKEYCLKTHTENLIALLDNLHLAEITFFVQDWGCMIGIQYYLRRQHSVDRMFFATPIVPRLPGVADPRGDRDAHNRVPLANMKAPASRWFRWILGGLPLDASYLAPSLASERNFNNLNGRTEQVLLNLGSTAIHVIQHLIGFQRTENIDDTWTCAYSSAFPTPQSCIGALNFPLDACAQLKATHEAARYATELVTEENVEKMRQLPIWLAVGTHDRAVPILAVSAFSVFFPNAPVIKLEGAGHFCQEDVPETLVALLQAFIQSTGGGLTPNALNYGVEFGRSRL